MQRFIPKLIEFFLTGVLFCAGAVSAYLVYLMRHDAHRDVKIGELLLAVIIACEGLFAIFHLRMARIALQAEAFGEYTRDFLAFEKDRHARETSGDLKRFPWFLPFAANPDGTISWDMVEEAHQRTYRPTGEFNDRIAFVTDTAEWWIMVEMAEKFQFAQFSCEEGYMNKADVYRWLGRRPLRWWVRYGAILRKERGPRKEPLYLGFEKLAGALKKREDQLLRREGLRRQLRGWIKQRFR